MKKLSRGLIALSLLCALAAGAALANEDKTSGKNRKKTVTLTEAIHLKDAVLEKGIYDVKFDAKKNELTLLRNGETVAVTPVTVEMKAGKAAHNSLSFTNTDRGRSLTSLTFEGDRRMLIIGETSSSATEE